jgi:hypothetical protein
VKRDSVECLFESLTLRLDLFKSPLLRSTPQVVQLLNNLWAIFLLKIERVWYEHSGREAVALRALAMDVAKIGVRLRSQPRMTIHVLRFFPTRTAKFGNRSSK